MTGSAALRKGSGGYWSFLDALVETVPVKRIKLRKSGGDVLLSELRRSPKIDFGTFAIDFCGNDWDFTGVTDLSIDPSCLRFAFGEGPMQDEVKLYVITSIIWRKVKVQTVKGKYLTIERAVDVLDLTPAGIRLLTIDRIESYIASVRPGILASTLRQHVTNFREFLEFHERMFGKLIDPDVIPRLNEEAARCQSFLASAEGYPCIPREYSEAVLAVAVCVMRDDSAEHVDRVTAASIVVLWELGFRSGEYRGLEAGSIEVVPGVAGMPDVAYLTFKTYKGARGDGGFALRRTVMSARTLEACLYLERACEKDRKRLGVQTLLVYPKQRARFCKAEALNDHIRCFLVRHADAIPCLNSAESFPELPTMTVRDAVLRHRVSRELPGFNVKPDDVLVYVTAHMFRVSFATRLYERGYDLAIIARFMNHITSDITVGYVRSEKEVERAMSDVVYRALLVDGADLLGPHGEEFAALVEGYAESLKGEVHDDEDSLIAACSERYPLRLKPGYVCTKCGNVRGCPSDSGTDEVFCAFGVCKNQHHMYFMLDVHLEAVRFHMRLVEENRSRGHVKAARNELRKARNVIEGTVLPELESLDEQLERHGEAHVIDRHPQLRDVVRDRNSISEEVESWLNMRLVG